MWKEGSGLPGNLWSNHWQSFCNLKVPLRPNSDLIKTVCEDLSQLTFRWFAEWNSPYRNKISITLLYTTYSLDYVGSTLANIGKIADLKALGATGSFFSPGIGAVGPIIYIALNWIPASDPELTFLQEQFQVKPCLLTYRLSYCSYWS